MARYSRKTIYFIQEAENGPIKIGATQKDIEDRVKSLQTGNPRPLKCLATTYGSYAQERALHRRFHKFHLSGEWFEPVPELLEFIKEKAEPYTPVVPFPWFKEVQANLANAVWVN